MGLSPVSASKAKFFLRRNSRRIMRSMKSPRYRVFMVLLLVVILWQRSYAALGSWKGLSRIPPGGVLPAGQASAGESDKQSSELARLVLDLTDGEIVAGENCSDVPVPRSCQVKNLTACVHRYGAGSGTSETFLLIGNRGETPLKVNVSFLPANNTSNEIQVSKQKKVNITSYIGENSSIVLDGGEGDCVIDMVLSSPFPPSITSGSNKGGSQTPDTPSASNVSSVAAAAKCLVPSKSCQVKNLTACFHYNRNNTKETLLLVQNGGQIPLTVDITLLPANITLELPHQQWETVNVTDKLGANTSIQVSAGDWECVVDMTSESNSPKQFSSCVRAVLLISGILIPAAALAYRKLRAEARRADEILYEQLEMGMASTNSTRGRTLETAGAGWDQSWGDDEWDEVKAVKSLSTLQKGGNLIVNGVKHD